MDKKKAALALLPGLDLKADFHTLPYETIGALTEAAKAVGYRKSKNAPGSTARMFFEYLARKPKTELLYVVQGLYQGWEDLTASNDYKEARADLKAYRENADTTYRLISRRVKIEEVA